MHKLFYSHQNAQIEASKMKWRAMRQTKIRPNWFVFNIHSSFSKKTEGRKLSPTYMNLFSLFIVLFANYNSIIMEYSLNYTNLLLLFLHITTSSFWEIFFILKRAIKEHLIFFLSFLFFLLQRKMTFNNYFNI